MRDLFVRTSLADILREIRPVMYETKTVRRIPVEEVEMSNGMDYYGPYGWGTPPPWQDTGDSSVTVSTGESANITVFPCDRATGTPVGYHEFAAGAGGVVICRYCGQAPKN